MQTEAKTQNKKRLRLSVKQSTLDSCVTMEASSPKADFVVIPISEIKDLDTSESLPVSLWFFYTRNKLYVQYANVKDFNQAKLLKLISLNEKYKEDFQIYVLKSDLQKFREYRTKCISKRMVEDKLRLSDKMGFFEKTKQISAEISNLRMTAETRKRCDDVVKDIMIQTFDDENLFKILQKLLTSGDEFLKHAVGCAFLTAFLCKKLDMSDLITFQITRAALLHDIGLYYVSPEVYKKFGKEMLTTTEMMEFMTHTNRGADIIEQLNYMGSKLPTETEIVAMQHHEKFNGTGYPNKLAGRQEEVGRQGIHLWARIISVTDNYCDLYDKHKNHEIVVEKMLNRSPEYDIDILKVFIISTCKEHNSSTEELEIA